MTDDIAREAAGESLAKRFHELYESLAPAFGYKTREESAKPWEQVPIKNRQLMTSVCQHILDEFTTATAKLTEENRRLIDAIAKASIEIVDLKRKLTALESQCTALCDEIATRNCWCATIDGKRVFTCWRCRVLETVNIGHNFVSVESVKAYLNHKDECNMRHEGDCCSCGLRQLLPTLAPGKEKRRMPQTSKSN